MYKELFAELPLGQSGAVIQPPASPADIQRAEQAVGCPFPPELRELLSEMDGDRWLLFSAAQIAHTAEETRKYLSECYGDIDRHLFFAGNGCGDYYCYQIGAGGLADGSKIFLWEHETNETRFAASGIAELITRYYHDEI